jgi:hypothetical protein
VSTNALSKLAAQTERLADGMKALPYRVVKATADVVEASIERAIGHDAPHRRVAGGGVGVTQRTLSRGEDARIMVKAQGALNLLANPTGPHLILPKTSRSGKTRRSRLANYTGSVGAGVHAMRTPYGPRYAVHHPGTPGKDTWRRGVDDARPLVAKTMATSVETAVREAFR